MKEKITTDKNFYGNNVIAIELEEGELESLPILSEEGSTSIVRKLDERTLVKQFTIPRFQENPNDYLQLLGYQNDSLLTAQKLVLVKDHVIGYTIKKAQGKCITTWEHKRKPITFFSIKLSLRNLDISLEDFSSYGNMLSDIKTEHLFYSAHGCISIIDLDRCLTRLKITKEESLRYNRRLLAPFLISFLDFDQEIQQEWIMAHDALKEEFALALEGRKSIYQLANQFQSTFPNHQLTLYETEVSDIPFLLKIKSY